MKLTFSDDELRAKAEELGLITPGEVFFRPNMRSRVAAALVEERRSAAPREQTVEPQLAEEIVVQPGGQILIDGAPFPWLVAREAMQVGLNPEGVSTVRLTLMARAVQIIKPDQKKEDPS
jgi:hypothetical protein